MYRKNSKPQETNSTKDTGEQFFGMVDLSDEALSQAYGGCGTAEHPLYPPYIWGWGHTPQQNYSWDGYVLAPKEPFFKRYIESPRISA
jgi:hypothetical protein